MTEQISAGPAEAPALMEKVVAAWSRRCRWRLISPPPRDAWQLVALRGSGAGQRIVLRLSVSGAPPVIVKARPELRAAKFKEAVKAQTAFAHALADHPKAHAPAVLDTLASVRAIVMEDAAGTEALRVAQKNPSVLPAVLKRCAGWMNACWNVLPGEETEWNPVPARKRLGWAVKKAPHLRDDAAFGRLAAWSSDRIDALSGQSVCIAPCHGDLHLSNILLSRKNNAWGIDFEAWAQWPKAYDMARLIAHTATMFGPQDGATMDLAEQEYRRLVLSGLSARHQVDTRFLDLFLAIDALVYRGDTSEHPTLDTRQRRARSKRAKALVDALIRRTETP